MIRNSAKGILIENDRVLLTVNRDEEGVFYLFPGGGQEHREALEETVVRELMEETGYTVRVGQLVKVREYIVHEPHRLESQKNWPYHQVEFFFRCQLVKEVPKKMPSVLDDAQEAMEWVPLEKLASIRLYPEAMKEALYHDTVYIGAVN